jgi:hypothetical protein
MICGKPVQRAAKQFDNASIAELLETAGVEMGVLE